MKTRKYVFRRSKNGPAIIIPFRYRAVFPKCFLVLWGRNTEHAFLESKTLYSSFYHSHLPNPQLQVIIQQLNYKIMQRETQRELSLLEQIEQAPDITQASLTSLITKPSVFTRIPLA